MVATSSGERYDVKHKIVPNQDRTCLAVLPSGRICDRSINFVEYNWLVPRTDGDPRPAGHWRHNPRPYVNR